ncbi:MAG: GNAT family N-acetyltransferase [Cyanobacteria bacterium J06623_1]
MKKINVRQATTNDLENLAVMFDRYRVFYRQPSALENAKNFICERLQQQDTIIFLAAAEDELVGYTQLFPSWSSVAMQRVWILNDLYVEPPHRNQGIAKALMNRAHEHAIATNEIG